jgi:antirestriction protein ArdC
MKRDLYAEVSARIIAELEAGAAPCVRPWSANPGANTPCNAVNNRPYSECDVVLLWMAQAALDARTLGEQNVASVCQEWDMDELT